LMDDLSGTLWLFGSALGLAALILLAQPPR
jgi:hypothetical protein